MQRHACPGRERERQTETEKMEKNESIFIFKFLVSVQMQLFIAFFLLLFPLERSHLERSQKKEVEIMQGFWLMKAKKKRARRG